MTIFYHLIFAALSYTQKSLFQNSVSCSEYCLRIEKLDFEDKVPSPSNIKQFLEEYIAETFECDPDIVMVIPCYDFKIYWDLKDDVKALINRLESIKNGSELMYDKED
jgi:hypothetical protein